MTGMETWSFVAPILLEFLEVTSREEWIEVYTNVFNGLKKLDEEKKHDISDSYHNGIGCNANR